MTNDNTNGDVDHVAASTADERDALFGDKLTHAIDAFGRRKNKKTTGDLCAELLGRVTSIVNAAELRMLQALEAARNGGN
jgi:hypothetical protein